MHVREITAHDQLLGYIVHDATDDPPDRTTFVTPHEANLQVGLIVKSAEQPVPRHRHKPVERNLIGTSEVLLVARGSGNVVFYDSFGDVVTQERFRRGDLIVLLEGGHALDFDEETVLVEVKQGPYPGTDEKDLY